MSHQIGHQIDVVVTTAPPSAASPSAASTTVYVPSAPAPKVDPLTAVQQPTNPPTGVPPTAESTTVIFPATAQVTPTVDGSSDRSSLPDNVLPESEFILSMPCYL